MKQKRRHAKLKSTTFNELNKPINLGFRKVQKNRKSISMILPKIWTDSNGVEVGDKVRGHHGTERYSFCAGVKRGAIA